MLSKDDLRQINAKVARVVYWEKIIASKPTVKTYDEAVRERSILVRELIERGVNLNA